jgi:hypothetical protein
MFLNFTNIFIFFNLINGILILQEKTKYMNENKSIINYSLNFIFYSLNFQILAGVPQVSDIAPFLYSIFAHDTPTSPHTLLGTYADDTIILASNNDPQVSLWLQNHLNSI